jgi:hypothetical protein
MSNKSNIVTLDIYLARIREASDYLTARKLVEGVLDWATIEEAADRIVLKGHYLVDFGTWQIWSGDVYNYFHMWERYNNN